VNKLDQALVLDADAEFLSRVVNNFGKKF